VKVRGQPRSGPSQRMMGGADIESTTMYAKMADQQIAAAMVSRTLSSGLSGYVAAAKLVTANSYTTPPAM
jgi:Rod binding domain-containing protein